MPPLLKATGHGLGFPLRWSLVLLICLVACARSSVQDDELINAGPPTWTYRKPDSGAQLYGLARSPIQADRQAMEKAAREAALTDLLLEVDPVARRWVQTHSKFPDAALFDAWWKQVQWEGMRDFLTSAARIEWYEEPDRGRVWLLMEVPRISVERYLQERREQAADEAQSLFSRGRSARGRGNTLEELQSLGRALAQVAGPEGMCVPGSAGGGSLLRAEIEAALRASITSLKVSASSPPASIKPGTPDTTLVAQVTGPSGAVLAMPLRFEIVQGDARLGPGRPAQSDGTSRIDIEQVSSGQARLVVRAWPDAGALVGQDTAQARMVATITQQWSLPQATFDMAVTPARILLTYIERGGTGGERGAQLTRELSEVFRVWGAEATAGKVESLLNPSFYDQLLFSPVRPDMSAVSDVDLIGVVRVELVRFTKEGKSPEIHIATGEGLFKLYDVHGQRFRLDVRTGTLSFSGFSQGDAERGFFLETMDRLRDLVSDALKSSALP